VSQGIGGKRLHSGYRDERNLKVEVMLENAGIDVQRETAGFAAPKTSYDAERQSLLNHASVNKDVKANRLCREAARILADQCAIARTAVPKDWKSRDRIKAAILAVDWDSSPGYPFLVTMPGKNNGDVIDALGEGLVDMVVEALKFERQYPTRVFVKQEPHKKSKVLENKERLISSVGLIEQIRDRVLFTAFCDNLHAAYPNIPVATGWADKKGVHCLLLNQFRKFIKMLGLDKGTWDWTVNELFLEMLRWFILLMHTYPDEETRHSFEFSVNRWFALMFDEGHTFVTSAGEYFVQLWVGIWKSGMLLTLVGNAIMNACANIYVLLKMGYDEATIKSYRMASFGDDTLQEIPEDLDVDEYVRIMRTTGAIIKDDEKILTTGLHGQEFCGHEIKELEIKLPSSKLPYKKYQGGHGRIRTWGLIPTRLGKMLANLLITREEDTFDALTSAKINWVNDRAIWDKLHDVQVQWCAQVPGWEGWDKNVKSYLECMNIAHGYVLDI